MVFKQRGHCHHTSSCVAPLSGGNIAVLLEKYILLLLEKNIDLSSALPSTYPVYMHQVQM